MPSSISCLIRSGDILLKCSGWFSLCVPMLCPASRTRRTPSGNWCAMRPMMKKVALTHWEARICRTWVLCGGNGPSSNVSTTSWSFSGSVSLYCMVPMRGCSIGSTTSVREVPSAFGLPGQSAARAGCTSPAAAISQLPTQSSDDRPARTGSLSGAAIDNGSPRADGVLKLVLADERRINSRCAPGRHLCVFAARRSHDMDDAIAMFP